MVADEERKAESANLKNSWVGTGAGGTQPEASAGNSAVGFENQGIGEREEDYSFGFQLAENFEWIEVEILQVGDQCLEEIFGVVAVWIVKQGGLILDSGQNLTPATYASQRKVLLKHRDTFEQDLWKTWGWG